MCKALLHIRNSSSKLEHIPCMHCTSEVAWFSLAYTLLTVLYSLDCDDISRWLDDPYLYRAWSCAVIMHNWLTWVGVVDRRDRSKGTICSAHYPYQVIRSKDSSLFYHIRHLDSRGHLLICLQLEMWQFFVDDDDNDRRTDQSLYPLRMHVG